MTLQETTKNTLPMIYNFDMIGGVSVFMTKKEKLNNTHTKIGDDAMGNIAMNYNPLDLGALLKKKGKVISSEEALRDVKPIEWDEEVLRGEQKITVTKVKE